jgi:hypothetical protein
VFFTDPYFMGHTVSLWPRLKDQVIEACSGQYVEAVLTGAIGTGKTTAALCILAFSTYQVMNLRDPHGEYQLDRNSEIAFVMQSVTGKTAFTVDYMRFRRMLENSPWFQRNAPHDPEKKATIQFLDPVSRRPVPLFVQPLPGTETAAIGENVFGGLIDEVNHMKVVQQSSKKMGGETHDQMLENYRAISRRRESRFQRTGKVPGMLCLVGSANYAGQFTDRKRDERDRQLERDGETQIYIFDKRPWEVQPDDRFSRERFRVFLGDGTRKPRVIPDGEATHPNDEPYLMWVPVDYRNAFDSDLPGAVKDIAGIALHGFSNFISNYSAIKAAFGTRTNIFDPGLVRLRPAACPDREAQDREPGPVAVRPHRPVPVDGQRGPEHCALSRLPGDRPRRRYARHDARDPLRRDAVDPTSGRLTNPDPQDQEAGVRPEGDGLQDRMGVTGRVPERGLHPDHAPQPPVLWRPVSGPHRGALHADPATDL